MFNGKIDWLWPSLSRMPDADIAKEKARNDAFMERVEAAMRSESLESIGKIEAGICELMASETSRGAEVGAKLTTVMGFMAIAISLALAILAVAHAGISIRSYGIQSMAAAIAGVIGFYVVLQLVAACLAALRGLERHGYLCLDLNDVSPRDSESDLSLRRRTVKRSQVLLDTMTIVNRKVSHMSISHTAIRNALRGFLLMVAALCLLLIARVIETDATQGSGLVTTEVRAPAQSAELVPASPAPSVARDSIDAGCAGQESDTSRSP